MKCICACFPMQLLVIANIILKQLINPEYHMRVDRKWGSNANGKTSIFDVSYDYMYVEKKMCPKEKNFLASVKLLIEILTSFCSRILVRIRFHQQLHPKPYYAFDIPDVP